MNTERTQIVTSTEIQNNFGKYLKCVANGYQIIITKNGKEVGRLISKNDTAHYLTDSLTGILKGNYDLKEEKGKILYEKYQIDD